MVVPPCSLARQGINITRSLFLPLTPTCLAISISKAWKQGAVEVAGLGLEATRSCLHCGISLLGVSVMR